MAHLVVKKPTHYDVLAEGLTSDGRVVRRVEARADGLADVAEAFRLAAAEARTAHVPVARVRLTAGRGRTEIAVTLDEGDPLGASALLDGRSKDDVPACSECGQHVRGLHVCWPKDAWVTRPTPTCTCTLGHRLPCPAHCDTPAGQLYAQIVLSGVDYWHTTGNVADWETRAVGDSLEIVFQGVPLMMIPKTGDYAIAAHKALCRAYGLVP